MIEITQEAGQMYPVVSPLILIVVVLAGAFLLRGILRRVCGCQRAKSDSIFRALGITAAVCAGLLLLVCSVYVARSASGISEVRVLSSTGEPATSSVRSRLDVTGFASEFASPAITKTSDSITVSVENAGNAQNGEMLLLPISKKVLVELLGEDGAAAVESLNASVPPELRQAYAMIPIPAGPQSISPVLQGTLGQTVVRQALSPAGLGLIRSAISEFISAAPQSVEKSNVLTLAEAIDSTPTQDLADWIDNPGVGQFVVKSKFVDASVPATEALRSEIASVLKARIAKLTSQQYMANDKWLDVFDVSITDQALKKCIVKTDARIEVIETSIGPQPMRQTYALIEFPERIEKQVLNDVKAALKNNRVTALCVTIGVLWLCAMFFSVAFRAGQSQSFLRKLATVPAMGLLIIPCMTLFGVMSGAMIRGDTFEFKWSNDRIVCVVDNVRD